MMSKSHNTSTQHSKLAQIGSPLDSAFASKVGIGRMFFLSAIQQLASVWEPLRRRRTTEIDIQAMDFKYLMPFNSYIQS